jgi:hypothetical protein
VGHPLRGERLQVFDSLVGGVAQEAANQIDSLVVRDMRGRLLVSGLSVRIVRDARANDCRSDGSSDLERGQSHRISAREQCAILPV